MSTTSQAMQTTPTEYKHIVLDERGIARIVGSRIKVSDIALHKRVYGSGPHEVRAAYPHLGLGEIYSAFAYYYDHQREIDDQIEQDEAEAARLRAALEDPERQRAFRERRAKIPASPGES